MKPVSPVVPGLEEFEFKLAENQPHYDPLPTLMIEGEEKRFMSRWEFSDDDRRLIAEGGCLILQQLTFGHPFQPVAFSIVPKPVETKTDDSCLCNGVGCARCCGPAEGGVPEDKRKSLLDFLRSDGTFDAEEDHYKAEKMLLDLLDDEEVTRAWNETPQTWYYC